MPQWFRFVCSCGRLGTEHTLREAAQRMHRLHANAARAKEREERAAVIA